MDGICLTVYFEDPFWVGVFERNSSDGYSVARIIFGEEPSAYTVYDIVNKNFAHLKFSPATNIKNKLQKNINAKRKQREAAKSIKRPLSTKAQEELKKQREQYKNNKQENNKEKKEKTIERKYFLKQQKKKEKKRGH